MEPIESSRKTTLNTKHVFNSRAYLASSGVSRKIIEYCKSDKVYSQGDPATDVLYIQRGGIKLSVVNAVGKEAVVAMLGPGDFFGEGGLAGQRVRTGTAAAITTTTLLAIEKQEMIRVLHAERAFSDRFVAYNACTEHPNRTGLGRSPF
jgi:CRP/FNR family transcriptional regulator, cyclic AMP receptor protein